MSGKKKTTAAAGSDSDFEAASVVAIPRLSDQPAVVVNDAGVVMSDADRYNELKAKFELSEARAALANSQAMASQAFALGASSAFVQPHSKTKQRKAVVPISDTSSSNAASDDDEDIDDDDLPFLLSQKHAKSRREPPPAASLSTLTHLKKKARRSNSRSGSERRFQRSRSDSAERSAAKKLHRPRESMRDFLGERGDYGSNNGSSRAGHLPNDVEASFRSCVTNNTIGSAGRAAEIRRLYVLQHNVATIYEKEQQDGGERSLAVEYAMDMAQMMVASLIGFDSSRSTDVTGKVETLVNEIVRFADKTGHRLGRKAREWLSVPHVGERKYPQSSLSNGASSMSSAYPYRRAGTAKTDSMEVENLKLRHASEMANSELARLRAEAASSHHHTPPAANVVPMVDANLVAALQRQVALLQAQGLPTTNSQFGSYGAQRRGPMICYSCQGEGHSAAVCPKRLAAVREHNTLLPTRCRGENELRLGGHEISHEIDALPSDLINNDHEGSHELDALPSDRSNTNIEAANCSGHSDANDGMCDVLTVRRLQREESSAQERIMDGIIIERQPGESPRTRKVEQEQRGGRCDCMACGECLHNIDVMEKEQPQSKRAMAENRMAHDVELRLSASLSQLNANSSNNNMHLTALQRSQSARDENENGEWHLQVEHDDVMQSSSLSSFTSTLIGKKMFEKHTRSCHFCKRKGHGRKSCIIAPAAEIVLEHEGMTPLQRRKQQFVIKLLSLPSAGGPSDSDIDMAHGLRLKYVQWIIERGTRANEDNPWKDSTKRRDKLRKALGYWWAIGADKTLISWIGFGVRIKPEVPIQRRVWNNHASYHEHVAHIRAEHEVHVVDGSFELCSEAEIIVSNPLQVEVNAKGKCRQCLDCRYTNAFTGDYDFTQETLNRHAAMIVQRDCMMITTDVAKAYYQVPLHKESQGLCAWKHDGQFYRPTILPFGLSVAPFVFTKIMRSVLRFMRALRIQGTNCIDDNLWAADATHIIEVRDIVQLVFGKLGWAFNEKCVFTPNTTVLYNGMWIDSKRFEIRATDEKIEILRKLVWHVWFRMRDGLSVKVHDLQVIAGRLQSLKLALEGVAVWTRGIYQEITRTMNEYDQRPPRRLEINVEMACMENMNFWSLRLGKQNGLPIRDESTEAQVSMMSDASDVGYGATIEEGETKTEIHGELTSRMTGESSTAREIAGVMTAAQRRVNQLSGKRVRIYMDSYPAIRNFINGGGRVELLSRLVQEWWIWCRTNRVTPLYEWIPRELNTNADELSKVAAESFSLTPGTEEKIRRWLNDQGEPGMSWSKWLQTKVVAPRFNNIMIRLQEMIRARRPACIITPHWEAGVWRPVLLQHSRSRLQMGKIQDVVSWNEMTVTHAGWTLEAHLVIPELREEKTTKLQQRLTPVPIQQFIAVEQQTFIDAASDDE
jgi:hypothetical protein